MVEEGLTVAAVREVSEALLRGFETSEQVVLDLGTANDVDIAGLQLLCAAHRFAVAHGKELLLDGIGERPRELARAAGFVRGELCRIGRDVPCFWIKMA
ncbi:MAG: STAS domain-containing protein [Desulfuromonadales bacterium]|nr:STAS domain-containing protein [Desulfuromonadales bacterium]